ncbi:MAG: ATP-binding cassette domain-containing protein [Pseudomonadota bacterium]
MALLEIESLRRTFGGLAAVDGIDFALAEGDLHALVGPNGCGKSTLFNLITGALRPSGGRVRFAGNDITGWPVHRIARAGIGRKFQVPTVFDQLTVLENLSLPRWSKDRLPLLAQADVSPAEDQISRLGLKDKGAVPAGALSHGERQWLEIGMLLAARARLLLLDEPTAGMTQAETASTAELIRGIAGDATVLVIEHDIGFIEALGCQVTVMAKGRVLCSGSFAEIRSDPSVRELYFGRAA